VMGFQTDSRAWGCTFVWQLAFYKLSFIHQAIACTKAHPLIIRFRSWNIIRSVDIFRFVLSGS
jgi:hypothetical protein